MYPFKLKPHCNFLFRKTECLIYVPSNSNLNINTNWLPIVLKGFIDHGRSVQWLFNRLSTLFWIMWTHFVPKHKPFGVFLPIQKIIIILINLKTCRNFLTNTIITLIFINLKHVFTLLWNLSLMTLRLIIQVTWIKNI